MFKHLSPRFLTKIYSAAAFGCGASACGGLLRRQVSSCFSKLPKMLFERPRSGKNIWTLAQHSLAQVCRQPSPAQPSSGQLAPARARRSWSGPGRRSAYYVVRFLPLSPPEKNSWESFGRLEVWHCSPLVSLPLLAPLGLRKCILEQDMLKLACRLRPRWHS